MKKLVFLLFFFSLKVFPSQQKDSIGDYVHIYNTAENVNQLLKPFKFFERDKELSLSGNFIERASYDLYYISKIQYKFGDLYSSIKASTEGLELLDSLDLNPIIERRKKSFYNHLGILSRDSENYENSFLFYSKVLNLCKSKRDSALAYNNISASLIDLKKYKEAKQKLLFSYKSFKELNDSSYIALALNNLGLVQSELNESNALDNMKIALEIRKKIKDPLIYESYKYITGYFLSKSNILKAKFYAKKGYEEAVRFNSLAYKYEALSDLIDLGENDYAIDFKIVVEEMKAYSDLKRNTYTLAKYNIKDEKEKRVNAEIEEEKAKSRNIIYLSVSFLILLIAFLLYLFLRIRHKKEKIKTRFETERFISKKLHDEVANDMYSMMSKLENDPNVEKELIDDLEEVYLKTRDISKAHAPIDFSQDYDQLIKDLIAGYKGDTSILTRNLSKISWTSISDLKKETLYRVIQELMTNMKKHSKATLVTLQFEEHKKKVIVTYRDNGIGCKIKYGNGLRNTENRMELVGGTITFESEINKGFQAKLII